jgi:histidinol-phosphate/aromatic aminotransferase/cobyric acid decarboxylase-like protein
MSDKMVVGHMGYSPDYKGVAQLSAPAAAALVMHDKLQPEIDRLKADNKRLREGLEALNAEAWECRGALFRLQQSVREQTQNGGMSAATRGILARDVDRAEPATATAMAAIEKAAALLRS